MDQPGIRRHQEKRKELARNLNEKIVGRQKIHIRHFVYQLVKIHSNCMIQLVSNCISDKPTSVPLANHSLSGKRL